MFRAMEVLGGVLVLGGIATPHISALQTQTQMNPCVASLYALFTYMLVGLPDFDLIEVRALCRHDVLQMTLLRGQVTWVM